MEEITTIDRYGSACDNGNNNKRFREKHGKEDSYNYKQVELVKEGGEDTLRVTDLRVRCSEMSAVTQTEVCHIWIPIRLQERDITHEKKRKLFCLTVPVKI